MQSGALPAPAPRDAGNARLRQVRTFIEQAETAQPDLMQMLLAALRGRLLVGGALGALIGLVLALGIFLAIKPVYQSQGLMRIVARESKILYSNSDDSRVRLFDAFVLAEVNYLSSPPVLQRTLSKLKTQDVDNPPQDLADLAKMITVTGQKGLVTVVATSRRAKTAAFLVNDVLDAYTELRLEQAEGQQNFRSQELSAREKSLLAQLQEIDRQILEVGGEYGDAIGKEHANKILGIDEAEKRIDELTTTINQLETVGYSLDADAGDAEIKRSMLLDNSMASMTYDRAKKAAELASLEKRYRADNPKVVTAKAEIAVLDKAIDDRRTQIATLGKTGALTQGGDQKEKQSVHELRALLTKLQERRAALETEARDLNSRMIRLEYLKEERSQTRANLDQTRGVLEEVRVESRNATPGVTEIVSRGSVPDRPAEDKRKAMAAVGFMVGIGIGYALIALLGLLRPTVRSENDIKALGSAVAPAGTFVSADDPVHGLRNLLHLALSRQEQPRGGIVAVIGAGHEQGVTTLARALAHSFHQSGSRTALVDGHLGKPDLSEISGAGLERGLTDWVLGRRSESLPVADAEGITILPAGSSRDVRDHSLSPHDVRHAMEHLAGEHDVVIADCGAAKQVLSSTLFAAHCDAVLMVLRRGISLADARSATSAVLATSRKQVLVVLTGEPENAIPPWAAAAARAATARLSSLTAMIKERLGRRK